MAKLLPFGWHTFDLSDLLPEGWQDGLLAIANMKAVAKTLVPSSVTSREASVDLELPVLTVGGITLSEDAPWLYDLYVGMFRDLAQTVTLEPVVTALDRRIAINLNVQRGSTMRYECHVDSNPVEALLYVTSHPPGRGGELVVAHSHDAQSVSDVEQSAATLYPRAGYLVFFDARHHAHFVRPLTSDEDVRVVVAMNYYTPSCSEDDRPQDLNQHLFGQT
jgi:hypothetical protein